MPFEAMTRGGHLGAGEHAFTHDPAGVTVTHADAFGDGTPLCGWIAEGETATADPAAITCRDCIAAKN